MIGYDFKGYQNLDVKGTPDQVLKEFLAEFVADGKRLTTLIQRRFNQFDKKHIKFDVFFLPFPSVVAFRNAFNAALD